MRNLPLVPFALAALLVPVAAQADASVASPSPREQFSALLLGTGKWPERIEVRGRILVVSDFVMAAREAGGAEDELARRVLDDLLLTMLTEELQHQKAWLSDTDYEAAYAAYAEPYDKTPFTVQVLATRFKGYPELAMFQRRWRVQQSFVRSNKLQDLDPVELQAQAKLSQDLLTGVAVEAEIWLHEAPLGADGRRDFVVAEQRARLTLEQLAAGKAATELPEGVQRLPPGKGAPMMCNPLRSLLGEGEYTEFHHAPVADAVFAAEPGKLLGPMRSKTGFCVARVARRQAGKGTLDIDVPKTKELLRPLLEQRRFLEWTDQVLVGTGIRIDGRPLVAPLGVGAARKAK